MNKNFVFMCAILLATGMTFQNCGQGPSLEESSTVASVQDNGPSSFAKPAKECQFLDVDSISSILKNQFEIESGDVPMLNTNGSRMRKNECGSSNAVQDCFYLADNSEAFGEGDISLGVVDDSSCSATKYKLATEVFVNACNISMQNDSVKDKFFPNGIYDYDAIYLMLIGRKPSLREVEALRKLASTVSDDAKELAVCAVVASSLEAMSKI